MNLAEYRATTLTSDQLKTCLRSSEERGILSYLETHIQNWAIQYLPEPGYHEHLPFSSFTTYLSQDSAIDLKAVLAKLKQVSKQGENLASTLENLLGKATQNPQDPAHTHPYCINLCFQNNGKPPH